MKLILQRQSEFDKVVDNKGRIESSTLGELSLINDSGEVLFRGYTCENGGESSDESGKDKRIVARKYNLEWTQTQRNSNKNLGKWQNRALWLKTDELPNFANRRILIHAGNYPSDTLGCILVGESKSPKGYVNSSVKAIIRLFDMLSKCDIKNVPLIVREIEETA